MNNDKIHLDIVINPPYNCLENYSAKELRQMGMVIPTNIPDCAVMKNGAFEYVTLEFTIKETE